MFLFHQLKKRLSTLLSVMIVKHISCPQRDLKLLFYLTQFNLLTKRVTKQPYTRGLTMWLRNARSARYNHIRISAFVMVRKVKCSKMQNRTAITRGVIYKSYATIRTNNFIVILICENVVSDFFFFSWDFGLSVQLFNVLGVFLWYNVFSGVSNLTVFSEIDTFLCISIYSFWKEYLVLSRIYVLLVIILYVNQLYLFC